MYFVAFLCLRLPLTAKSSNFCSYHAALKNSVFVNTVVLYRDAGGVLPTECATATTTKTAKTSVLGVFPKNPYPIYI